MKKCFYLASLICGATAFTSCSTADDSSIGGGGIEQKIQDLASSIKATFGGSRTLSVGQSDNAAQTTVTPRTTAKKRTSRAGDESADPDRLVYLGTAPKLSNTVPQMLADNVFLQDFPNGENNLEKTHENLSDLAFDFLYESNGEPIEVYMLYSHAYYINDVGIYCIDKEGNLHTDDMDFSAIEAAQGGYSGRGDQNRFWSMNDYMWSTNKEIRDGVRTAKDVPVYNRQISGYASSYKFQIPKGWKFGFWINNDNDGKKYSESARNERPGKGIERQVVTYTYYSADMDQEFNLVGFEDTYFSESDKDFNDVIMMVYPKQTTCPTGKITVRWITEDNTPLCPDEYSPSLNVGDSFTGYAKEFEGYELTNPSRTEETKTLTSTSGDTVIEFVYKQKAAKTKYTVNYLCKDGCAQLATETFEGEIGDVVYATEKMKLFEGHSYETADKAEITLAEDEAANVINLYYIHSQAGYIVKYLEEGTETELADPTVVSNKKVGDEAKVSDINISGYTCTNPGEQTKTLAADPNSNVFIYYYKKNQEPAPIVPTGEEDIVIILDALDKTLVCESDDFGIKYNQYEMEYAYTDRSASNLANLKLEQGKQVTITIDDINAWTNNEKIYWFDLGNGIERACFDLRLYDCRDEQGSVLTTEELSKALNLQYIKKPDGCNVQIDCIAATDQYGKSGVHISVLVDRLKATE